MRNSLSWSALLLVVLCLYSASAAETHAQTGELRPRFENFPAAYEFQGKPPEIVWPIEFDPGERSNEKLVSAAQSAVQKRANFAGHYGIAEYSCGTSCGQIVVVDLKTGVVLRNSPYITIDSNFDRKKRALYKRVSFRQRSRLLIAAGCFDWDVATSSRECGTKYFEFKNDEFALLKFVPGPIPGYLKDSK